jgi:hypothetical protein
MIINDIKVRDEKIVIISEEQILKALGLSKHRYELYDVDTHYNGKVMVTIKIISKDVVDKSIKMDLVEAKTLDAFIEE